MDLTPLIDSLYPVYLRPRTPWSPAASVQSDPVAGLLDRLDWIATSYLQVRLGQVQPFLNGNAVIGGPDYGRYLQLTDRRLGEFARTLVARGDSDDTKAEKIRTWVEDNITYADDRVTYRQDEYWAMPTETLRRGQGDCEDGAFLMASLMLHVGVNPNRVRVYGGFVSAGTNASTGGHAWVAYAREADSQFVALDWCYFPTDEAVDDRSRLKDDKRYVDDLFYVTATATVETPLVNTLNVEALPDEYRRALAPQPGQLFTARA